MRLTTFKATRIIYGTHHGFIAPCIVSVAPIHHRRQVRLAFKTRKKDIFRAACAEVFGHAALHNKTVHHILPICLYGTNEETNLIYLPERIHKACHFIIDEQIKNMRPSERREINLPMFRNARIIL